MNKQMSAYETGVARFSVAIAIETRSAEAAALLTRMLEVGCGDKWVIIRRETMAGWLPWMSISSVPRVLARLVEKGFLKSRWAVTDNRFQRVMEYCVDRECKMRLQVSAKCDDVISLLSIYNSINNISNIKGEKSSTVSAICSDRDAFGGADAPIQGVALVDDQIKKTKPRKPLFDPTTLTLPAGLKPDLWCDFIAHRKSINKPITELSAKKIFNNLSGECEAVITEAINTSIANGWTGIFTKPSGGSHEANSRTNQQGRQSAIDRVRSSVEQQPYQPDNIIEGSWAPADWD